MERWTARYYLDLPRLQETLSGRVHFFGTHYDVGPRPDWNRDPKTGRQAPMSFGKTLNYRDERTVGDIKTLWELNRHQHLVAIAIAYAVTGEARYKVFIGAQIDSWIQQNPYGFGVNWCSALEVALRAVAWCTVHSVLCIREPAAGLLGSSSNPSAVIRSLFQHGSFINGFLSRHSSANNHLIGELVGLWCLANVFDFGEMTSSWRRKSANELNQEIINQVWSDGVAKEQAVHYQLEVMEYYTFAWSIGQGSGHPLSSDVLDRLAAMLGFLEALTPIGGSEPPQIGDSDEGIVCRFRPGPANDVREEIMEAASRIVHPHDGPVSEKAFWYGEIAGLTNKPRQTEVVPTGQPIRTFEKGGYVVLQSDGVHVVFDCGPLGYPSIAAHGHADALSFCVAMRGRWWLIDPGTYCYHDQPDFRSFFRGTRAHNTILIGDQDQSTPGGAFLWTRHARAVLLDAGTDGHSRAWVAGEHDGYRTLGFNHRRRVVVEGSSHVLVEDELQSNGKEQAPAAIHFHFAPELDVELEGLECRSRYAATGDAALMQLDSAWRWQLLRASTDPMGGWYSKSLGSKEPCWTLRGDHLLGSGTTDVRTTLRFDDG